MTRPSPAVRRSLPLTATLLLASAAWSAASAHAAVNYGQAGSSYTQNFDWTTGDVTLGSWSNNSAAQNIATWAEGASSLGWFIDTGSTPTTFRAGSGLTSTRVAHNFFTVPTDADRSFGSSAVSASVTIALLLRNTTASTLTEFTFTYAAETTAIRSSSSAAQQTAFSYHVGTPADWVGGAFTQPGFPYNAPLLTGPVSPIVAELTAVDGNSPAFRVVRYNLGVTGLAWAPGQDLWLRWKVDSVAQGVNFGLDDFSFTAIPEPGSTGLWIALAAGAAVCRRRRERAAR